MKVHAYSTLTDEVVDLGVPNTDVDQLLNLAETIATDRPGVIVYLENPPLQKWETP